MLDFNSYYAYHTNNLSFTDDVEQDDGDDNDAEKVKVMPKRSARNGNDIISASLSHSLSLGSVNEKCLHRNPTTTTTTTTAAEDNNCTLRISSCKPLKFPLASEWLV
ncbi:uncharacterized protein LOC133841492 [Drosophila sulfurigaster albostrigata]|uniref:uncharacterized protein LOC133841492 n=1 Tax=Drosophila sulfurigaster albostrigata TaxID=89887 RepID=UPI002D21AB90|nr:uncharacterized protein LOC133841492 [Drosophila sulfurigaster albostrigata]